MAKRVSFEARILEWVDTAPLAALNIVIPIIIAKAKARNKADAGSTTQPVVRRKRKAKTTHGKATDFNVGQEGAVA